MFREPIKPECNVRVTALRDGEVVEQRESHNIITNVGRNYLRNIISAITYDNVDAANGFVEGPTNVYTSERVRYMAFGVGGAFSADPYYHIQEELVTVTALEDYVKITDSSYLKEVDVQGPAGEPFPTQYSVRFACQLTESDISFANNVSKSSALTLPISYVGTDVAVSEAGLYLSGANPAQDLDHTDNNSRLIAYNIFQPIHVTQNIVLRVEWEFRF